MVNRNSDSKFHTKASSRLRRRACLWKSRSINSCIWWLVESKQVDQVLVREIKKNLKEVWIYSVKMVMEWCFFFVLSSRCRTHRVRTHVVATTVCATGGVNTLRVALTFFWYSFFAWRTEIAYTHGSSVRRMRMSSLFDLVFSLLMFHPSPSAVPWRSLRDDSRLRPHRRTRPHHPAELSRPKSAGQAHSARGWAVWLPGQVHSSHILWAQGVGQDCFRGRWHDTSSTIRTTMSLTSRNP